MNINIDTTNLKISDYQIDSTWDDSHIQYIDDLYGKYSHLPSLTKALLDDKRNSKPLDAGGRLDKKDVEKIP